MDWQPIETPPAVPTEVVYWYGNTVVKDMRTGEVVEMPKGQAVDFEVGYWDGHTWRDSGTNHEMFEFGARYGDVNTPTHWMPLPEPPK